MHVDYLIIGQGISGTWLSYYLHKEDQSFLVIDDNYYASPSRIAAGIINPVTGRRHVEVWMADEILPFARQAYTELGNVLNLTAISQKSIIDFFPSLQMRLSFQQRVDERRQYVFLNEVDNKYKQFFNYEFGYGEIKPVYIAHLQHILPAWRKRLIDNKQLSEEKFEICRLTVFQEKIQYKNITARKIIFCDGNSSINNPYFKNLPFAPNKGEALTVEIPNLPPTHIYKKGLSLVPLEKSGHWWVGSNHAWEFDNENPTAEFRKKTEQLLKNWLNIPFQTIDHFSAIRPSTLERRPFVGLHPQYPSIGILNGLGTKGCSLAPFFARQLVNHLLSHTPILPQADIKRFSHLL